MPRAASSPSDDCRDVAACLSTCILKRTVGRRPQCQAIARRELMHLPPFLERQATVEYPNLLVDQRVRGSGEGDASAWWQSDMGQLKDSIGWRRNGPAHV